MSSGGCIVAGDIGGTWVRLGLVDEAGQLAAHSSHPSAAIDHPEHGPEQLADLLERQLAEWIHGSRRLSALALGFPSTVSRDRRVVLQTPNLRGFDNTPMADLMEKRFGVPVLIERDVTFLLAHDMGSLGLSSGGTTIGIYFGTGIGNAIFLDGSFLAGRHGVAGELGHVPLGGASRECGCGNTGCMETEASGGALARLAAREFPGEHVADVFQRHGQSAAVAAFLEAMSHAPAMEINILDPDDVVIGGGVVRMASFPREELRRRILSHVRRPLPFEKLRVHFSPGDDYAGVLGGARLAVSRAGARGAGGTTGAGAAERAGGEP